ncbi:MAG TPA: cation-transporting P-type ATPase [Burkholderiaceae bacterium]
MEETPSSPRQAASGLRLRNDAVGDAKVEQPDRRQAAHLRLIKLKAVTDARTCLRASEQASTRMDEPLPGLSSAEARARQDEFGRNEIESRDAHGLWQTLRNIASEPMFDLLLLAAGIYLAIGNLAEGLLLALFALVTVGLVVFQERRSERALDALRELAAPQARVIRDEQVQRIAAIDLVPGDRVLVAEGERVPADVVLGEATGLSVDESLLTGEAVPVRKRAAQADETSPSAVPGGDDQPFAYASTLVVAGHGVGTVTHIGRATRVGGIGRAITSIAPSATSLERRLRWLVRAFGIAAAGVSGFLLLWYGAHSDQWVQGLLAGLALAMAMLPEEFQWCSRSSWRSVRGGSRASRCWRAGRRSSRPSVRRPSSASTRPAR